MMSFIKILSLSPKYREDKTLDKSAKLIFLGWKVKYEIRTSADLALTGETEWNKNPADIREVTDHIQELLEQLK